VSRKARKQEAREQQRETDKPKEDGDAEASLKHRPFAALSRLGAGRSKNTKTSDG